MHQFIDIQVYIIYAMLLSCLLTSAPYSCTSVKNYAFVILPFSEARRHPEKNAF